MNPFLWPGPAFLLFYVMLGILLLIILHLWIKEEIPSTPRDLYAMANDPYRIAYLRGGVREAIQVVTISLVDRGLLKNEKRKVQLRDFEALKIAQRPIEREVLRHYHSMQSVYHMPTAKLRAACDGYREELTALGLLATWEERRKRLTIGAIISGCLLITTLIKLDIAFQQGKHNVLFLIMLTAAFIGFALWSVASRRTTAGDALLSDLQTFFGRLKLNAYDINPGGATNEAVLLAAIFGARFLPNENFPFVNQLYPRSDGGGGDGGSGGDGGGGGCGGGCGGCGG
jgi:uncharacterized protein (TIGR04222 family)